MTFYSYKTFWDVEAILLCLVGTYFSFRFSEMEKCSCLLLSYGKLLDQ